ncbi:hypothetical protein N7462_010028 [Penicillium macrosclerotiorum]|uniref:uncharacterized protein n=1 Tax=Penicillium macrosclerotiorum TaxID=303699 RepID=UPI002548B56F|nr:uncharacterized protein N7462_010028 [Penicillium macrosclerotiorum]KAJ5668958.1 hypothetical protein N7462_010028 [Penicillium macrosclerotiorum]
MPRPYLTVDTIRHEIEEINPQRYGSLDTVTSGVWSGILALQFPIVQGYLSRPQQHQWVSEQGFWTDILVQHTVDNRPRVFFVVMIRTGWSPSLEVTPGQLEDWTRHLSEYLDMTYGLRWRPNLARVYGAMVVGRGVRFFTYDIGEMEPMLLDYQHYHVNYPFFDLVRDAEHVQIVLDEIRRRH